MGKSSRVHLSDLRKVYQLLEQVCEMGDDPERWRPHLCRELRKLLRLQMATVYVMPLPLNTAKAQVTKISMDGLDEGGNRAWFEYGKRGDLSADPCSPAIIQMPRPFAASREMLASKEAWYGSAYYNDFRRLTRSDDLLVSLVKLPGIDYIHGISGDRAKGDRPIGRREIVLTGLIQQELLRKWQRLSSALPHAQAQLPPRLSQMLERLRGPDSEKEIASQIGLSRYTVHNHIRRLYARLNVRSRAELVTVDRQHQISGVPRLGVEGL